MNQKFSSLGVVFLAVYITEAHARDEWPCGKSLSFCDQPKTNEERCYLANLAKDKCNITFPYLVDTIENQFETAYAAWPFRFYGFLNGKLSLKPQPNTQHFAYLIDDLENWLNDNISKN